MLLTNRVLCVPYVAHALSGLASAAPSFGLPGLLIEKVEQLRPEGYDYIVVGGGTSGLTVANRLTENAKKTVLVIEAGSSPDNDPNVLVPGNFQNARDGRLWDYTSLPQTELNNRTAAAWPPKTLGGGSAINGMFFDRASKADYDAWEILGNPCCPIELTYGYVQFETFHPATPEIAKEFGIQWDPSVHGSSGPVHISYPPFMYPSVKLFFNALKEMGISIAHDGSNGNALGGFWVPNALDPNTMTRSFAKTAYNDPIENRRSNYHLLLDHTVTKVIIDTNHKVPRAVGVTFAQSPNSTPYTVLARKDVILAAGAYHTPRLLKLSGIGAADRLKALGIEPIVDLPGVGENLQDHAIVPAYYTLGVPPPFPQPSDISTNATYVAEVQALYTYYKTGPLTNAVSNSVAFLPVKDFASMEDWIKILEVTNGPAPEYYKDKTLIAGWKRAMKTLRELLASDKAAALEVTSAIGAPVLALERPFSRGYVDIASSNPWEAPLIDWRSLTHPVDIKILTAGLKWLPKLLSAPTYQALQPRLIAPDLLSTQSDEALEAFIRGTARPSFYHPSGTAQIAKREWGGVVDSRTMKVWGVDGIRVVDASVIPFVPATHICTTVYAVAEKAADIIKATAKE
ncbi:hypothetical protein HDV00_001983 [Rhizophlyctis rosea]|nr:hypothetical protein HDV00_001983 [Rhizophlyctis rosea]